MKLRPVFAVALLCTAVGCNRGSASSRRTVAAEEVLRLAQGATQASRAKVDVWYSSWSSATKPPTITLTLRSKQATDQLTLAEGGHARWRDQLFSVTAVGSDPPHFAEIERRVLHEDKTPFGIGGTVELGADEARTATDGLRLAVKTIAPTSDGARVELELSQGAMTETLRLVLGKDAPSPSAQWKGYTLSGFKLSPGQGDRLPVLSMVIENPRAVVRPLEFGKPFVLKAGERAQAQGGLTLTFKGTGQLTKPAPDARTTFNEMVLSQGAMSQPFMLEKRSEERKVPLGNRAYAITLIDFKTEGSPEIKVQVNDK
jgi:hypothetical protein